MEVKALKAIEEKVSVLERSDTSPLMWIPEPSTGYYPIGMDTKETAEALKKHSAILGVRASEAITMGKEENVRYHPVAKKAAVLRACQAPLGTRVTLTVTDNWKETLLCHHFVSSPTEGQLS